MLEHVLVNELPGLPALADLLLLDGLLHTRLARRPRLSDRRHQLIVRPHFRKSLRRAHLCRVRQRRFGS